MCHRHECGTDVVDPCCDPPYPGDLLSCSNSGFSLLRVYVAHSAFKDSRFRPLELPEVPDLEVKVSLLVNYEDGENAYDWEVRGGGGNSRCIEPLA